MAIALQFWQSRVISSAQYLRCQLRNSGEWCLLVSAPKITQWILLPTNDGSYAIHDFALGHVRWWGSWKPRPSQQFSGAVRKLTPVPQQKTRSIDFPEFYPHPPKKQNAIQCHTKYEYNYVFRRFSTLPPLPGALPPKVIYIIAVQLSLHSLTRFDTL